MRRLKIEANFRDNPSSLTWQSFADSLTIKLANPDIELSLELGADVIRQLRQALSWTPLRETQPQYRETA